MQDDKGAPAADEKKGGAKTAPGTKLKVSEKGALSVYGLGRFPVTLYKEQWKRLLGLSDEIKAFIAEHDAELKTKGAGGEDKAAEEKGTEG